MLKQIDAACAKAGVWPHAFLSGHAHNYQRLTRTRTADGTHVAYCELPGSTGTPIVYLPGMVYSIESVLDDPPYARFVGGLTELGPVVLFERQGIAASVSGTNGASRQYSPAP